MEDSYEAAEAAESAEAVENEAQAQSHREQARAEDDAMRAGLEADAQRRNQLNRDHNPINSDARARNGDYIDLSNGPQIPQLPPRPRDSLGRFTRGRPMTDSEMEEMNRVSSNFEPSRWGAVEAASDDNVMPQAVESESRIEPSIVTPAESIGSTSGTIDLQLDDLFGLATESNTASVNDEDAALIQEAATATSDGEDGDGEDEFEIHERQLEEMLERAEQKELEKAAEEARLAELSRKEKEELAAKAAAAKILSVSDEYKENVINIGLFNHIFDKGFNPEDYCVTKSSDQGSENKYNVMLRYKDINMENNYGNKHHIGEMIMKFTIKAKMIGESNLEYSIGWVYGLRTHVTERDYNGNYRHSHLTSGRGDGFSEFCLGTGIISRLVNGWSRVTFEQFIDKIEYFGVLLRDYLEWESIEGVPYYRISDIPNDDERSQNLINISSIRSYSGLDYSSSVLGSSHLKSYLKFRRSLILAGLPDPIKITFNDDLGYYVVSSSKSPYNNDHIKKMIELYHNDRPSVRDHFRHLSTFTVGSRNLNMSNFINTLMSYFTVIDNGEPPSDESTSTERVLDTITSRESMNGENIKINIVSNLEANSAKQNYEIAVSQLHLLNTSRSFISLNERCIQAINVELNRVLINREK